MQQKVIFFFTIFDSAMSSTKVQHIKNGDYFITCLPLPQINQPSESPLFTLMGNDYNVKVVYEAIHRIYDAYIQLKIDRTGIKPNFQIDFGYGDVTNYVEPIDHNFEPITINSESFCFESLNIDGVTESLPPDYQNGDEVLKFVIKFSFNENTTLQFKSRDKSVQTGSYLNTGPCEGMSDFSEMLTSTEYSDVEIKCGKCSFKAHKCVLCARSPVLKASLQCGMRESQTGIMEIPDMDAGLFEDFLRYLYTNSLPDDLSPEKAKALYEAGDRYAVYSLVSQCREYIRDNLSLGNFLDFFTMADCHFDQTLKAGVKAFVLKENVYLNDELWLPFCEMYPWEANAMCTQVLKGKNKKRKFNSVQIDSEDQ